MQPQSQSYIEIIPKEIGLELLERMTTEQVEKLLYNNPFLLRRYGEYLEERLEAEVRARKAHNKRLISRQESKEALQRKPKKSRKSVFLLNPRATRFLGLRYRDAQGRGYYSITALTDWTDLFMDENRDQEGFILLTPKEQEILGLPPRVKSHEFEMTIFDNMTAVNNPPQEIVAYLEQEERDLHDLYTFPDA